MDSNLAYGLGLGATAIFASLGALFILAALQARDVGAPESIFNARQTGTLFLFDGVSLVDCTPGGRALLAASPAIGTNWNKLIAYLSASFPEIDSYLARLPSEGTISLSSEDSSGQPIMLHAELRGGLTRITLIDAESDASGQGMDLLAHRAMTEEVLLLRQTLAQAPILVWRERTDGAVIWANANYLLLASDMLPSGEDLAWPLPRLFERTASNQGATGQRQKLHFPDGRTAWFDLISVSGDSERKLYALPADSAVQAETTLRDFMQTLTKTFAHLPIGLAIFDNKRNLQLFNPALLDLTGLAPDFLSMRPSLLSVLDAMRERKMVPEPKDYGSWRRQIVDFERAAAAGVYEETWNLPGGQTYRVIGRPHPNGALALMLEDISNEITRTRRFHADLELGQSVIDSMDEAVAVFSPSGMLVMTNAAYSRLWAHNPVETLGEGGIAVLSKHWRSKSATSPIWAEAEDFVATMGDRENWQGSARLLDGRLIACRFTPLAGGATLIGFKIVTAASDGGPKLQKRERRSA
jgi:PAS domain-containing protein